MFHAPWATRPARFHPLISRLAVDESLLANGLRITGTTIS